MKRLQHIFNVSLLGAATLLAACSNDDLATDKQANHSANNSLHTLSLQLNASKPSFEQTPSQRAEAASWKTGDKLRLIFEASGSTSTGTATYSAESQQWTLQYTGNLASTSNGRLTAYYFETPTEEGNTIITLNGQSAIYADTLGTYSYDGASVSAVATLQPANSRLRFQGQPGDTIYLTNLAATTAYDIYTNTFTDKYLYNHPLIVSANAASDGKYYTDYIYCTATKKYRLLNQAITVLTNKQAYTHQLSEANLQPAVSGYLTLPGNTGATNWMENSPFANLQFPDSISVARRQIILNYLNQMVKVDGGNLTLGKSGTDNGQVRVHMYPFYFMKTEVSNLFFTAVMNYNPTYNSLPSGVTPDDYPLDGGTTTLPSGYRETEIGITSDELVKFINKLNQITGLTFDIPYETEWEYAARGGQRSHEYTTIANVSENLGSSKSSWGNVSSFTSNNYKHIVSEGPANELGIYGLCSNVSEACRYVGNYSALSTFNFAVDKVTTNNVIYVIYRGATGYEACNFFYSYCLPYPCGHKYISSNKYRGLRLILRYQDNL